MIFADASPLPNPTPTEFMVWLACSCLAVAMIAFLAMAYNQVGKAKDRMAGKRGDVPQPLEVKGVTEFVNRKEFERERQGMSTEIQKLQATVDNQTRVASIQRKSMYDHMDSVRKELSDKIANMPAEIVTQLLNTKNLWKRDKD